MEKNLKLTHPKDGSLCYMLETNRTAQIILQHKLKKLSSHLLMTDWAQQIFIFTHIIYLELFLVKKILYTCTYICTTYKTKYMSVCVCVSWVQLFPTPWTIARQDPQSVGFSRQEHWSGLPFPSPGDLPNPEIEPGSHIAGQFFTVWVTGKPYVSIKNKI